MTQDLTKVPYPSRLRMARELVDRYEDINKFLESFHGREALEYVGNRDVFIAMLYEKGVYATLSHYGFYKALYSRTSIHILREIARTHEIQYCHAYTLPDLIQALLRKTPDAIERLRKVT